MSGVKVTTVKLPHDLAQRLAIVLARENKPFTDWLKDSAETYLKAHENGNPSVPLTKFIENPQYVACPTLLEASKFHWRGLDTATLQEWRAVTFRLLKQIQDEEGRRKAGGQPE